MKVIAGLGNPGAQYANTPHSIGFEVADAIAREIGAEWRASASFKGELATGMFAGQKVLLLKPMTYMNLSGDSVAPVVRYHNATPADLLVISDDIDLPVGRIRVRVGGSAGGHNGLKSIIERVGTPAFTRLRVGVGRDAHDRSEVIGHVLGKFDPASRAVMDQVVPAAVKAAAAIISPAAVKAAAAIISSTPQAAMNAWNGWSPTPA